MKMMKQLTMMMVFLFVLCCVLMFPGIGIAGVTFKDGDYVRIGYSTAVPPVWKVKNFPAPWEGNRFFIGPTVSSAGVFSAVDSNSWIDSDIRQYLNGVYLTSHFSDDELATGVLTPYDGDPVVTIYFPATYVGKKIRPSVDLTGPASDAEGAGDSLIWIASVNELLAIYNGSLVPWDDSLYYASRLEYSLGASEGYWTRSIDTEDASKIWKINPDGSFSSVSASASSIQTRPVISADETVMLYKRGAGSEVNPYKVCYPWRITASVSANAGANTISLRFPESIVNNGIWPGADAWDIADDAGNKYFVVGTSATSEKLTLTVYPSVAPNVKLSVKYSQRYDYEAQGLNNTKGAILCASAPCFALSALVMEVDTGDTDKVDNGEACKCGDDNNSADACTCGDASNCDCDNGHCPVDGNVDELVVITETLPDARVGEFYTARLYARTNSSCAWKIDALPDWLSLDESSGVLTGMPLISAIHDLMTRVEVSNGDKKLMSTKRLRLSVYPHDGLLVNTSVLPAAIHGKDYSVKLEASGGIPPYIFALRRGDALPPGLTLDNSGLLSGRSVQRVSEPQVYDFTVDVLDGNGLQGSASYTMVLLSEDTVKLSSADFLVKEYEGEARVRLTFTLPKEFSGAKILSVEGLISPDASIVGSSSLITPEKNGESKVHLTVYLAEQAINSSAGNWKGLLDSLIFEGYVVRFQNASGESLQFEAFLPVQEMKREDSGDSDRKGDEADSGGGCDVVGSILTLVLPAAVVLIRRKTL